MRGSGSVEVYGNNIAFPETMIYGRPIPGARGKIALLGASHCCPNNAMGTIQIDNDRTGTMGRLFKDLFPVSEERMIVSYKPPGPE